MIERKHRLGILMQVILVSICLPNVGLSNAGLPNQSAATAGQNRHDDDSKNSSQYADLHAVHVSPAGTRTVGALAFADVPTPAAEPPSTPSGYGARKIAGWTVFVSKQLLTSDTEATQQALELLSAQLKTVVQLLPPPITKRLQQVPIWLSPPYPNTGPKGEYHPNREWLVEHGRDAKLAKCIELTNTAIFAKEIRRMPVLLLHELAHAYHDQVLGFNHADVKSAYETAKKSGSYDAIRRSNGKIERAYAMTNEREYFAETTEAFFGTNDFYPFNRAELKQHDPDMEQLLTKLWSAGQLKDESAP